MMDETNNLYSEELQTGEKKHFLARIRQAFGKSDPPVLTSQFPRANIWLRLRAVWRHPLDKRKRRSYRNRHAACAATSPKLERAALERILSHFNAEDLRIVRSLEAAGKFPNLSAVVVTDLAFAHNVGNVIESLRKQESRVKQIFVFCPDDLSAERIRSFTETISDDGVIVVRQGEAIPSPIVAVNGLLVLAASVLLRSSATAIFGIEIQRGAKLVYCDEVFNVNGGLDVFFKPSFSKRLAKSSDYLGSCGAIQIETSESVSKVEEILQLLGQNSNVAQFLTRQALSLPNASVIRTPFVLFQEKNLTRRVLPAPAPIPVEPVSALVSIIIPTRDRIELLKPCVESIFSRTSYPHGRYEVIIVDNGSVKGATLDYLSSGETCGRFKVVRDTGDFNYSRLNNRGVAESRGDILLFLNNDTIITQSDWLSRLAGLAMEEDVGVVGAKLLYEDGSVQHGGVVLGIQGVAAHIDVNAAPDAPGYHGLARHNREVSAVTGACMATKRANFFAAGQFDENLAVAFNDTLLCIRMLQLGLVNIQSNSVFVTHLESKSRGFDNTSEKMARSLSEGRYAREQGLRFFLNDDYYSPNLSLQTVYKPAEISRRLKPWRKPFWTDRPAILFLSSVHQRGHGVPVVLQQQALFLVNEGWTVHVGGPLSKDEVTYSGCKRAVINDIPAALSYAQAHNIDIIMPHTPPFFSVSRYAGLHPLVAAYNHGEPPPSFFPKSAAERQRIDTEKWLSLMLAKRVYCNSASVKLEAGLSSAVVAPLGNSHLNRWTTDRASVRRRVRAAKGWENKVVVLNVCRFHEEERQCKGVNFYIDVAKILLDKSDRSEPEFVFVQCGNASPKDVTYVTRRGLYAIANVSDEEMDEIYCAADIYANFSQWEGWNLGISQALAYGLPIVASNIQCHRLNFSVPLANSPHEAAHHIRSESIKIIQAGFNPERRPVVTKWSDQLRPLGDDLLAIWRAEMRIEEEQR
jgi:GT2 family glycosyltransferase